MSSMADRLWPLAWPELTAQIEQLRDLCAKDSTAWLPGDTVTCGRIFHTMKSTMAMLEVGALSGLFAACEAWLKELAECDAVPDVEGIVLISDIVGWTDIHLGTIRRDRLDLAPDAALADKLGTLRQRKNDQGHVPQASQTDIIDMRTQRLCSGKGENRDGQDADPPAGSGAARRFTDHTP